MEKSDNIEMLAAALAKAQAEIKNAAKDSENPHFRSKYADLASVWDACRGPLTKHGLSVIQMPHSVCDETGKLHLHVRTMLLHASGQWLADTCEIPIAKLDAQGVVAGVTYGRRAGLAAIAGVAPGDDDDGETAVGRGKGVAKAEAAPKAEPYTPKAEAPKNDGTGLGMIQSAIWNIAEKTGDRFEGLKHTAIAGIKTEFGIHTAKHYKELSVEKAKTICEWLWLQFGPGPERTEAGESE